MALINYYLYSCSANHKRCSKTGRLAEVATNIQIFTLSSTARGYSKVTFGKMQIRGLKRNFMQKFEASVKVTPVDTPLVHCSVNSHVRKENDLCRCHENIVPTSNNPEEALPQHKEEQKSRLSAMVYVINMRGNPLMPCSCRKARVLLKNKKAKVAQRSPFTIQLLYATGETTEPITLGFDPGYAHDGFSARTATCELISGELEHENGMSKRLQERSMYRRNRRSRLWHRPPRWRNRTASKKEGWLPPSTQRRLNTHASLIKKITRILPVTDLIIEIAKFDIQKIENPEIEGMQYQQGSLYQYRNRIAFLIAREHGKCQYCHKEYNKNDGWRLHHIWGKSKDRSQDWALVHESCHKKLHLNKEEGILQKAKSKSYKNATYMNVVRNRIKQLYPMAQFTYGYITFQNRVDLQLPKTHYNDAFVISGGTNQERIKPFNIIQKKKNNRCLQINRQGYKPSIRRKRYKIQPKDSVWIEGKEYISKGCQSYGKYVCVIGYKKKVISIDKIEKYFNAKTLRWDFLSA